MKENKRMIRSNKPKSRTIIVMILVYFILFLLCYFPIPNREVLIDETGSKIHLVNGIEKAGWIYFLGLVLPFLFPLIIVSLFIIAPIVNEPSLESKLNPEDDKFDTPNVSDEK